MNIIWVVILASGLIGAAFLVWNFNQESVIEDDPNENEEVDLKKEENLGV